MRNRSGPRLQRRKKKAAWKKWDVAEVNTPFSHTDPERKPPPYEKKVEFRELYLQLPVISQEGSFRIMDDEDRLIEFGQADTTIKMYPSSKSKKKITRLETKGGGGLRIRRTNFGDNTDQSDLEENLGGYDPAVRRILARVEKKGDKISGKKDMGKGDDSSNESEDGDSDEDWRSRGASASRGFFHTSNTRIEEDRQRAVRDIEESIDDCMSSLLGTPSPDRQRALEDQLEELQIQKKKSYRRRAP
ncbi:hypothetical protein D5F01_LYC22290 [Larimichthys crocea]|uniref:Uncharacterized protein n=1 Tax=Larimichthys crocea TaxID=215358 RepID=A0A6G0HLM7_LARCR|nr:hypothetical protein D5F01_LYC22290 [Larimichthys crocea]